MMRLPIRLLWAVALLCPACGSKSHGTGQVDAGQPCPPSLGTDRDGDGYGDGCPSGYDCDDNNPAVHDSCGCDPARPMPGCPCPEPGSTTSCFTQGSQEQAGIPPCKKGAIECQPSKVWGPCEGEVPPESEVCDGVDNDCDGNIDDGVLSACGNCVPGCDDWSIGDTGAFPMPGDPLPPGASNLGADGVGLDPSGDLVLTTENIDYHFLWVANSAEGTVSKLDTETGKEVARYSSVTHDASALVDVMAGANPANVPAMGGANSPSRTAVDFFGNVWVGNRAPTFQPTATKIFNNRVDCRDRNGNGTVETSSDVNGNGVIDKADPAEFFGEQDECIAFTVMAGTVTGGYGARAAAIDAGIEPGDPGNAWIGMYDEMAFYQLDGRDGHLLRRVPVPVHPYGAAIDSQRRLWAPDGCCGINQITAVNTVSGAVIGTYAQPTLACNGSYGIAIDQKDRVWLGAWGCGAAIRFDPATLQWNEVPITGYFGNGWGTRGIGADGDGNVWVAVHKTDWTAGAVARINADALTSTGTWSNGGVVPVGAAMDFDGNVWTVNNYSNNASRLHLDPTTKEPAPHPTTGNQVDVFPVGSGPYTYSDFTGFGLRTITRSQGDYSLVLEPCANAEKGHWTKITYDATTPPGTAIQIWVRAGDDLATMASWTQYGPWVTSPADLQAPPGPVPDSRYLLVIVRLQSLDRQTSPIVHSWDIEWACPTGPIN